MIRELFINLTILITSLFFYFQLLKKDRTTRLSSKRRRVLLGVLAGVLGIILMEFGFMINDDILVDFRHIPIMLSALYAGWLPAVISAAVIASGRLLIGINSASILAFLIIVVTTGAHLLIIRKERCVYRTIFYMLLFYNTLFSAATYWLIPDVATLFRILVPFWMISFSTGIAAVYLAEYMRKMNSLFYEYEQNALIDPLTGLNNVRSFDAAMNAAVHQINIKGGTMSLCIIDIDHFKRVNDTYGHPEGDAILKQLGALLKDHLPSGIVSRNGGEEFTIILPSSPLESAFELAETLREKISQASFYIYGGKEVIRITASIGIASGGRGKTDSLYREADQALYRAKQDGRNRVCAKAE